MYSNDGYDGDPILVWKTDGEFVDLYQGDDDVRSEWAGSSSGSLSVIVAGYECGTEAELDAVAQEILDNFETKKNTVIPVFSPIAGCEIVIDHTLELLAEIGDTAEGSEAEYSAVGLEEDSTWTLRLRSTPQTLATGTVPAGGEIGGTVVIPAGLEAGWHSITLAGTDTNGDGFTDVVWFQVDSNGIILAISEQEPVMALASTGADEGVLSYGLALGITALLGGFLIVASRRRKATIEG